MNERTKITVNYMNTCIQEYSGNIDWSKIMYSLEGWAEYFATTEYDSEVSDYAPKFIQKLNILKEYIENDRKLFEADIDCLIQKFGLNLGEAKLHLDLIPMLDPEPEEVVGPI